MVLLCLLLLSACGGGSAAPPPVASPLPTPTVSSSPPTIPTGANEREVVPQAIDARVADTRPHVVINAAAPGAKGRLFVMLAGTRGPARGYRLILREGTARGYHAIGLSYDNGLAVNEVCPFSLDPDCAGNMRLEIIEGADRSPLVAVAPPASIVGRLTTLLTHLAQAAPNEGWDAFLTNGQPNWSRISVGGHSQGSGHAGLMSKLWLLDRAVMFSGPGDLGAQGRGIANWLSLPAVTPAARLYGFTHREDELVPVALVQSQWRTLGLEAFGGAVEVDGRTAYSGPSRQLVTSVAPNPAGSTPSDAPFHGATVVDPVTPLDAAGQPLFAATWTYLAFP